MNSVAVDPAIIAAARENFPLLDAPSQAALERRMSWLKTAKPHQLPPKEIWWSIWLLLAGRGAGKTRSAAEWIGWAAWRAPPATRGQAAAAAAAASPAAPPAAPGTAQ